MGWSDNLQEIRKIREMSNYINHQKTEIMSETTNYDILFWELTTLKSIWKIATVSGEIVWLSMFTPTVLLVLSQFNSAVAYYAAAAERENDVFLKPHDMEEELARLKQASFQWSMAHSTNCASTLGGLIFLNINGANKPTDADRLTHWPTVHMTAQ